MSQPKLNTNPVPGVGTDVPPAPMQAPGGGHPPPASQDQVLSWEAAMGRAEQGAAPSGMPCSPAEAAGATGNEWSPMNPNGAPVAAGDAPGAQGAAGAPSALPASAAADVQAQALPGAVGQGGTHMSPEELLQRQWDRIAMGLEPGAAAPTGAFDDALSGGLATGDEGLADVNLAQPVTLAQPIALGWQSLPVSERPVTEGMTVDELVTERHVEEERHDERAHEAGDAVAAEQARLAEVNTPETLPERTIESV
ncbi:MAG: hypothetical protein GTN86_12630 [Xanthomonadales bacterium]|uniref:hypothetical protein n=1 Tax=Hydrogenophaga sp. TaxID=1904254 RepID=UPI0016AD2F83|nr:hypothetical protein [Hydrogenophaga sp.]NIQ36738.1 hypothetical protein [Xanthomonadales bacterium]NIM42006.1 hypothetical protein [Hydrogenophaga sp.]NIN27309.1 hypothetical protein [Hydrogenophaga sp.]NIN32010.1 hypothetical protein [Hydrogenophaga sp.]NIN56162.1 hypothetical protein [Hydrogenophaga sp.]